MRADRSLCLELRENYVNVYYRGGNLMRLSPVEGGYAAFFDLKYFEGAELPFSMPAPRLREPADVAAWLAALPWLKQGMALFLGRHPKDEAPTAPRARTCWSSPPRTVRSSEWWPRVLSAATSSRASRWRR